MNESLSAIHPNTPVYGLKEKNSAGEVTRNGKTNICISELKKNN